ncbi:hypothetical protein [Brevundimonas sp.]|uniref:hypothetical protein n=1 Tax=Brevundimonas sp. TaxID=1871086 RepID=UPI0026292817|nr:hypothetical protein [Brevundimonas sp.]
MTGAALDTITLDIPDEHELLVERDLSHNDLRALEVIDVHARGLADVWVDQRVITDVAQSKGWARPVLTLASLENRGLVSSHYPPPGGRPHARSTPKSGTLWRMTHEGMLEHAAQRGRLFR